MSDEAGEIPTCEHHWVSKHQPDFPEGLYWVGVCSLCERIDGRMLAEQVAAIRSAAPSTPPTQPDREALARVIRDAAITSSCASWSDKAGGIADAVLALLAAGTPTETAEINGIIGVRDVQEAQRPLTAPPPADDTDTLRAALSILDDHRTAVADFQTRIDRITEAHHKHVDEHGGTYGDCNECGAGWPCATYRWATAPTVTVNCTWDLAECEFDHDHDDPPVRDEAATEDER